MALSLWPFSSGGSNTDLRELVKCMPEVGRPIEWDNEVSCSNHSIINMVKNCEKPRSTLQARLQRMTLGFRRKGKTGGRPGAWHVVFDLANVVEIPAAEDPQDENNEECASEHAQLASTFLSALPRPSSGCLLGCVAEDEEGKEEEEMGGHDESDSVCSAGESVRSPSPRAKLRKSVSMPHFEDLELMPAAEAEEAWETQPSSLTLPLFPTNSLKQTEMAWHPRMCVELVAA
jgi:hypothetical protein